MLKQKPNNKSLKLLVLGSVCAGIPALAADMINGVGVPEDLLDSPDAKVFRLKRPLQIKEKQLKKGDLVIVDVGPVNQGDIVAVRVERVGIVLGRFFRDGARIMIFGDDIPENYNNLCEYGENVHNFNQGDGMVFAESHVEFIGVVVGMIRKLL